MKIIDYDLRKPGRDYSLLYAALNRIGAVRVLESSWVTRSTSSCAEIRDYLTLSMDSSDGVFVAELTGSWASSGISSGITDKVRAGA